MGEAAIECEVTCRLCGWHTAGTILPEGGSPFEEVLTFLKRCWPQHPCPYASGEMLIVWAPAESGGRNPLSR